MAETVSITTEERIRIINEKVARAEKALQLEYWGLYETAEFVDVDKFRFLYPPPVA